MPRQRLEARPVCHNVSSSSVIINKGLLLAVQGLPYRYESNVGMFCIRRPYDGSDTCPWDSNFRNYVEQATVTNPSSIQVCCVLHDSSQLIIFNQSGIQYQTRKNRFGGGGNVEHIPNFDIRDRCLGTIPNGDDSWISLDEALEQAFLVREHYCCAILQLAHYFQEQHQDPLINMPLFRYKNPEVIDLIKLSFSASLQDQLQQYQQNPRIATNQKHGHLKRLHSVRLWIGWVIITFSRVVTVFVACTLCSVVASMVMHRYLPKLNNKLCPWMPSSEFIKVASENPFE